MTLESIDMEQWPRKEHFQFFSGLSFPFYSVTTELDVTKLKAYTKKQGLSFYYAMIYATMKVINTLPDFLYKVRGSEIVKHDKLDPSFVVMDAETHFLKIVNADFCGTIDMFCNQCAQAVQSQTTYFPSIEDEHRDDLVYISCTPWFSFTSLSNEMDCNPDDSIPRVTWGKFTEKDGALMLPYSIQLNHRLLDGWHLGQLINGVQAFLDSCT